MIEFRNVHASYDEHTPILKGVSFAINDGEFVAFVGTNGAGKSTTMRLMNGLLKPEVGEVLINSVPTTELKTSELARQVGFLFQNPDSQICCNTVRDELQFGFKALGMLDDAAKARVESIIWEFGFDADADPFLLNRGSRQLLALASIVVLAPPVVILDE
ncbi:MAG: ABC transporter ATP-binding protein, partial [Eggerthellaceae bacterium]|nr:ABC transporter ATP-binding protein [Eggerthellaceae bacterium]